MKAKYLIGALVIMPVVAIAVLYLSRAFVVRELPKLGMVKPFELVDTSGKKVTDADLKRNIWIASFIFSSCGEQCPLINEQMKWLQKELRFKDPIRLVSVTVDPNRDTPAVLAKYAARYDADPSKWLFLTGRIDTIKDIMRNSFKLGGDMPGEASGDNIMHSSRLVLVDNRGAVRGYYDAMNNDEVRALASDAKSLLRGLY
jgi:protein SCO1